MFFFGLIVGLFVGFNLGLLVMAVFQVGASNDTPQVISETSDTEFEHQSRARRSSIR